jgi:hypothetical protein
VFRKLIAALRRFFSRRAARKLLTQQLPRGLPAPQRPFQLALRVPRLLDAPPGEFWTLPLGAQAIRGQRPARLLRLAALPPPLRDLGIAQPACFRLDGEFRLPPEVDPLRISSDAPSPAPVRRVRPRTPLPRAPVWRLRPRNFRLDAGTLRPANEGIVPLEPRDTTFRWVRPAFRSRYLDTPWMARQRFFQAQHPVELFTAWWFQWVREAPGGKYPATFRNRHERELWNQMEKVKEQMLIRRDVKKDEHPPGVPQLIVREIGLQIASHKPPEDLAELIPGKEWIEPVRMPPPLEWENDLREVVLQWRTLVNALEER